MVLEKAEGGTSPSPRKARRFFLGRATVLLIGIAMIVLPGPAVVVIPIGLAILATEFVWARKWLDYAKRKIDTFSSFSIKKTPCDDDTSDH